MEKLRIVVVDRPPIVMSDGLGGWRGYLIDLLHPLLETANISIPYEFYETDAGGMRLSNGTWSGVMGELVSRRANLSLAPLTLTSDRLGIISSTLPYMDDGYAILVQQQQTDSAFSFLMPFDLQLWLAVLGALLFVVVALMLLDWLTRRARNHSIEQLQGAHAANFFNREEPPLDYLGETVMAALASASRLTVTSWAPRIMFVAWVAFTFIMYTVYTAQLTAAITVAQLGTQLNSIEDLAASGSKFGVLANSNAETFFKHAVLSAAKILRSRLIAYPTIAAAVADVRAGKIAAFAAPRSVVEYQATRPGPDGACDLVVGREAFGPGELVIGLQPNSSLEKRLSLAMLQLADIGVLSGLRYKWFVENSVCDEQTTVAMSSTMRLSDCRGVFVLLAAGAFLSFMWALVEVHYYRGRGDSDRCLQRLRLSLARLYRPLRDPDDGTRMHDICRAPSAEDEEAGLQGQRLAPLPMSASDGVVHAPRGLDSWGEGHLGPPAGSYPLMRSRGMPPRMAYTQ